ncbi:MAG: hypothetical protein ABGY71_14185 [bacterium]
MQARLIPTLLLAMLFAAGSRSLVAQDAAEAQEPQVTPSEHFDALEEEVAAAEDAWREEQRVLVEKAEQAEPGESMPALSMMPPYGKFVPRFLAAAEDYAGSEDAVPFLIWIASRGIGADQEAGKQAIMTLVENHAKSPSLTQISYSLPQLLNLFSAEEALGMLGKLQRESPVASVRAWAVFARVADPLAKAPLGSDLHEAAKKEIRAAMQGVDDPYLKGQIAQGIEVREKFSTGMVAPDIEGVDLDGQSFKLSNYRGQVIFLDFWGDW